MYCAIKQLGAKLYIPSLKSIKKQFKYSSDFFLSRASVSLVTNLKALKENCLWLSSPDKFNDIYDCRLNINSKLLLLHNILNEDWYKDNPFDRNELLFLLNIQKQIRSGNMNLELFALWV